MARKNRTNRDRPPGTGMVPLMKGCLAVSLIAHAVLLAGLQKMCHFDWFHAPLETYHVEFLRPAVDPFVDMKKQQNQLAWPKTDESGSQKDLEDTISLETKDKRYASYAKIIKSRLMRAWEYPRDAWENLLEGDVLALFSLDRQGHLKDVYILKSSRHEILDRETVRTIREAAPFPPFPGSVTVRKLNIRANFAYRLTVTR